MKRSHSYLLVTLLTAAVIAFAVFRFVNKPVTDFGSKPAELSLSFADMMNKVSNDTASLSSLKDRLVGITGRVKKITPADSTYTLELGDSLSMSSILCQIDVRYKDAYNAVKPGDSVAIQGILIGFSIDTELGFGNTVQMKSCSPLKK